ncbi:MAG: hypothetical protein J6Y08_01530 [Clostridiales bacterium]|nr:hypothetical protein [Clostridiales bacterium]
MADIEMNRSKTPAKKRPRITIFVAVSLLVLGVLTSSIWAVVSRNQLVQQLDEELDRKTEKMAAMYNWQITNEMQGRDLAAVLGNSNNATLGSITIDGTDILVHDIMNDKNSKGKYHAKLIPVSEDEDVSRSVMLFIDKDGDSVFVRKNIPFIDFSGLIYRKIPYVFSSYQFSDELHFNGINLESMDRRDLTEAAAKIVEEKVNLNEPLADLHITGWHEDMRYLVYYGPIFNGGVVIISSADNSDMDADSFEIYLRTLERIYDPDDESSDSEDDPERTGEVVMRPGERYSITMPDGSPYEEGGALEVNIESEYSNELTVIFLDASADLASWKNQLVKNISIFFGAYVLIVLCTWVIENTEMKKEAASVSEDRSSTEEKEAEIISPSAAKELLSQLDEIESSFGANGYLEQIRDDILSCQGEKDGE